MKRYLIYLTAIATAAIGLPALFASAEYNSGDGIILGVRLDACSQAVCSDSD